MTPTRRKWFRRVLILLALAVVVWLVASYAVARTLTRRAAPITPEPVPVVPWGTAQSLRLNASDGQELGAWFFAGHPDMPVVVLLHGNGGCRTSCLPEAELLVSSGHSVLSVTVRAHGDSTGDANDIGFSARRDLIAAVEWIETHRAGTPIVVWGRSLGSAAALFAANDLGSRVSAYILECPYRDLRTAVWNRLHSRLPWGLRDIAFAGLQLMAPLVLPDFDKISPCEAAIHVPRETPVLVLSGSADCRATPAEASEITDRLGPRAELVVIEGGDHLELAKPDPARYRTIVLGFLERCRSGTR